MDRDMLSLWYLLNADELAIANNFANIEHMAINWHNISNEFKDYQLQCISCLSFERHCDLVLKMAGHGEHAVENYCKTLVVLQSTPYG